MRAFEQLDRLIFETADLEEQLVLIAKRCSTFARFSMIERAVEEVQILRAANPTYIPRVTAWIIFCEGLIHHFSRLDTKGTLERLIRAKAIAEAIQEVELSHACLAWIATSHFVDARSDAVISTLNELFGSTVPIKSETASRAFLVLADLLSWAGRHNDAQSWYRVARINAVEYGDLSLQALIMFNSTAFEVAAVTLEVCLGNDVDSRRLRTASLLAGSVANLDAGIGQPHMEFFIPLLLAEVFILEMNWRKAIELIDRHLKELSQNGLSRLTAKHLAQRALANLRIGDIDAAIHDCSAAEDSLKSCDDVDDLVVIHSRLGSIYREIGKASNAVKCEAKLHLYVQKLGSMQSALSVKLEPTIQAAIRSNEKSPARARL